MLLGFFPGNASVVSKKQLACLVEDVSNFEFQAGFWASLEINFLFHSVHMDFVLSQLGLLCLEPIRAMLCPCCAILNVSFVSIVSFLGVRTSPRDFNQPEVGGWSRVGKIVWYDKVVGCFLVNNAWFDHRFTVWSVLWVLFAHWFVLGPGKVLEFTGRSSKGISLEWSSVSQMKWFGLTRFPTSHSVNFVLWELLLKIFFSSFFPNHVLINLPFCKEEMMIGCKDISQIFQWIVLNPEPAADLTRLLLLRLALWGRPRWTKRCQKQR